MVSSHTPMELHVMVWLQWESERPHRDVQLLWQESQVEEATVHQSPMEATIQRWCEPHHLAGIDVSAQHISK